MVMFMDLLLYILIFSIIGGLISLIGGVLLLGSKQHGKKLVRYVTPFAAGGLLATVFLDLIKEGAHEGSIDNVLYGVLFGILGFFLAERFLHWFHHHHEEDEAHNKVSSSLIITGDTIHNALDGVAIAAAFLISIPTGIITTLAVAAHEIPQEIGDFGLLLERGMKRKKILLVNIMSSLATTAAAVLTYLVGSSENFPIEILLGVSAGFLLYIAMSDIIPTIHKQANRKKLFDVQPIMLLVGVLVVGLSISLAHRYIDHGHDDHATETSQVQHKDEPGKPHDDADSHAADDHAKEEDHAD